MRKVNRRMLCVVTGRVQGVAFRYHTALQANQLRLQGWVRNNRDGTVQIEVQGEESTLHDFIRYLHRGPAHAKVDRVETKWIETKESSGKFRVVR